MNGKAREDMPKQSSLDRANAREWLEEMGFVIDDEEKPQTNSEPTKHEPAA